MATVDMAKSIAANMLFSSRVFSRSLLLCPIAHQYHARRTYHITICIHWAYTPFKERIAGVLTLNYAAPRNYQVKYMPNSRWLQTGTTLVGLLMVTVHALTPATACADELKGHQAERSAIRAVLDAQEEAWNRGDIDAFLKGYWHSPNLTFSGSNGIFRGWDAVMARYKKNYPDRSAMGALDFSNLEFRFLGPDAALVLGHWHLKRQKDEIGGVFTLVFQRFPEGWRIIHDHTSASPMEANPK